jgi:tetratricopeptide (TPR) repeat protein
MLVLGANPYPERGEFHQAIKDLDVAIRLDPKNAGLYIGRGTTFSEKGAIADFNESIRMDPRNWIAYRNRAIAYTQKGEFNRDIIYLDELIRLNSSSRHYIPAK